MASEITARILQRRGSYAEFVQENPVLFEGELVVVTDIPWYKSWFGLKPTRLKYGTNKTFKETRFL